MARFARTARQGRGRSRGPAALRLLVRAVAWMAIGGLLAVAAGVIAAPLLGFERYVITGGSMGGSIPRGSVVFEQVVPVSELEVGDVITYHPPADEAGSGLVTHRIVAAREREGKRILRTQGDANPAPDPWRFHLLAEEQPRVVLSIPLAGYALAALGERGLRMIMIGVPALLIGVVAARRLWRDSDPPTDLAAQP